MIKEKKKGLLIIVSSPSGGGKGSINKKLLENDPNRWFSISTTSRNIRTDDIPGVTYNFISKEDFENKIKENYFLEYTCYNGNYYGTPKEFIDQKLNEGRDVILEIEIEGARNVKNIFPDAISIFILPPSIKELIKRLKNRNTDTNEVIMGRIKRAYEEINEVKNYDYFVINDEIDNAVNKIETIIKAERNRTNRISEIILDVKENEIAEIVNENKD